MSVDETLVILQLTPEEVIALISGIDAGLGTGRIPENDGVHLRKLLKRLDDVRQRRGSRGTEPNRTDSDG